MTSKGPQVLDNSVGLTIDLPNLHCRHESYYRMTHTVTFGSDNTPDIDPILLLKTESSGWSAFTYLSLEIFHPVSHGGWTDSPLESENVCFLFWMLLLIRPTSPKCWIWRLWYNEVGRVRIYSFLEQQQYQVLWRVCKEKSSQAVSGGTTRQVWGLSTDFGALCLGTSCPCLLSMSLASPLTPWADFTCISSNSVSATSVKTCTTLYSWMIPSILRDLRNPINSSNTVTVIIANIYSACTICQVLSSIVSDNI